MLSVRKFPTSRNLGAKHDLSGKSYFLQTLRNFLEGFDVYRLY
jgi:hypothetical protein